MKVTLLLAGTIAFGMVGCGKNDPVPAPKATNAAPAAKQNPLTAPVDYLGAVGRAKHVAEKTVDLASVNQAIQIFNAQEDRFPKDLNELVTHHYLQAIPPAPPGMQLAYNPATGELRMLKR